MLSAADGGVGNINGDDVMFGFNALDAILGEICVQLSARAEKALRDSEALVTEVLRNPNLMDDAATERMREGVQQGNFFVQREKVLAEAVEGQGDRDAHARLRPDESLDDGRRVRGAGGREPRLRGGIDDAVHEPRRRDLHDERHGCATGGSGGRT